MKGVNVTLLQLCRLCYHAFPQIRPTVSDESSAIRRSLTAELTGTAIPSTRLRESSGTLPTPLSVVNPEGRLLRQWGKTGTGDGAFDFPGGIALGADGRVYVADQTNRRVQVFDRNGKFLFKWGEYGVKEGQFGGNITPKSRVGGPHFLAIDGDGNIYTTEGSVGRIQKFTADGKFVAAWGDNEDKPGSFGGGFGKIKSSLRGPVGICFDEYGHLWISSVGARVQQFTKDGKFLQNVSRGEGIEPGQFTTPHALATDSRGRLYVVDAYNHRIQKFAIGN